MFPNSNQNKKPVSVNTRGRRISNSEGKYPALVELGYWDGFVTLRIHPALSAEQRSDTKKWDMENYLQTTISPQKGEYILRKLDTEIYPAIEAGTDAQVNIIVGNDSIFQIATKRIGEEQITLASIFKGLDPGTRKPSQAITYQFAQQQTVTSYDPESGAIEMSSESISDLDVLKRHIEAGQIGATNGLVHAHRVTDRVFRERLLGTSDGGSSGGGYQNKKSPFAQNETKSDNSNPFGVEETGAADLAAMMNM